MRFELGSQTGIWPTAGLILLAAGLIGGFLAAVYFAYVMAVSARTPARRRRGATALKMVAALALAAATLWALRQPQSHLYYAAELTDHELVLQRRFPRAEVRILLVDIDTVTINAEPGPDFIAPKRKFVPTLVLETVDGEVLIKPEANYHKYKGNLIAIGHELRNRIRPSNAEGALQERRRQSS